MKPINRLSTNRPFTITFEENLEKIISIKTSIESKLQEPICKTILEIRTKYIAHNDLHKRSSLTIEINELRNLVEYLLDRINNLCQLINLPTSRFHEHENHSLDKLLLALAAVK